MKNVLVMICLIVLGNCYCQSKKETMEYFNINKYKDWEVDNDYSLYGNRNFFKKGNDRIRISFWEDGIQVRIKNIMRPYEIVKCYSNISRQLTIVGEYFYEFSIGTDKEYDKAGKLINEIDNDKPYKFSLKEVLEKVKKEYEVDLEDKTQRCVLERFESDELNGKSFYGVSLRDKENPSKNQYILLDGTTGEILFTTYFMLEDDDLIPPFAQYIESLKKAKQRKPLITKHTKARIILKKNGTLLKKNGIRTTRKKRTVKDFGMIYSIDHEKCNRDLSDCSRQLLLSK